MRLAYTTHKEWEIPHRTNVCALFWRGLFTLAAEVLLAVGAGYALAWFGVLTYMYWEHMLLTLGLALAGAAVIIGVVLAVAWIIAEGAPKTAEKIKESVPGQAFIGWKEKHCRLVEIDHYD